MLTNLFEGYVYLRNPNGDVHEFTQSNYWNILVTGFFMRPTLELSAGASHRFEHSLLEFIDWRRQKPSSGTESYHARFPTLDAEFQPGSDIWCTLEIHEWKSLGENRKTTERTALLVTEASPFPRR